jgi:AI-2 transport protein TqsA
VTQDQPTPGASYTVRALVALAAAFVLLVGLWWARDFVGPAVLGAVVVMIVHPLRFGLERRGWRRGAATTVVVVTGWLVIATIVVLIAFAGSEFVSMVEDYRSEFGTAVDNLQSWLVSVGVDSATTESATSALDPQRVLDTVASLGSSALAVAGSLFLVFSYVLFMAADGARYSTASGLFGTERRLAIGRAESYTRGVRRYYVVSATFGAIVAVIDGIALAILGVPAPVVWAILAFVTNFVPNIGFVLGLIPPAILGLVIGGWPMMLAVIAIYCSVNVVLQVLVQPKFVSDAVDLSLTLSFASVTFWTFVLGPVGAILSIPLTLLFRTLLLEPDGSTGWLRWLSGDSTAVPAVAREAPTVRRVEPGVGPGGEPGEGPHQPDDSAAGTRTDAV